MSSKTKKALMYVGLVFWMLVDTSRNKKLKELLTRTRDEYGVTGDETDILDEE